MPTDVQRARATATLVAEGHGARLVHSQDVCTKTQLRRFGGAGYDHMLRRAGPLMRAEGMDPAEVRRQLAGNALALVRGEV
jgi:phosphotriesterase-related protein